MELPCPFGIRCRSWLVLAGFLSVAASFAAGVEDDCKGCGEPAFPEAAEWLASQGYPSDEYVVLLRWEEVSRTGPRSVVTGYHVFSRDAGDWFDLYSGADGNLLDGDALAALGIRAKQWDLPPVEQRAELPVAVSRSAPMRPVPVGVAVKAATWASLELPALDVAALLAEDVAALLAEDGEAEGVPRKGARRIGIARTLPRAIEVTAGAATVGAWRELPCGALLWSVTLVSPGANAVRAHFSELAMPAGACVVVYNPRCPSEAYGPYVRPFAGDADLWSASCFSDSVTVECHVPAGATAQGLKLVIEELVHTYADFATFEWAKAGYCNQDVSCFPEWVTTSLGVAGFAFISHKTQLHCTGSLIADTDPDTRIPYFLTANHCVSSEDGYRGSANMEFFWLYQTPACDEDPPPIDSVPRNSDGADFLATSPGDEGTDFALVRLRSMPPEGLTYPGWSTAPLRVGDEAVCVHHPSGGYKRISFGTLTEDGSPQAGGYTVGDTDYERYYEVLWHTGTTEHGSSGSPLFAPDGQLIIGQLWGGYASCSATEEPDYYGRFDVSFPLVAEWLSPAGAPPGGGEGEGEPPSPPTGLGVSSSAGQVVLHWEANTAEPDLAGYHVHRAVDDTDSFVRLNTVPVTDTSYMDTSAETDETYIYRITAAGCGGVESEASEVLRVRASVVVMSVSDHTAGPGEETWIALNVNDATGIGPASVDIELAYDAPILDEATIEIQATAITGHLDVVADMADGGAIRFSASGDGGVVEGRGHLFDIHARVRANAEPDACGGVGFGTVKLYTDDGAALPVDASDTGTVCVSENCALGDLNGDGVVDGDDTVKALKAAAGLIVPNICDLQAGDPNGDRLIDCADAAMVSRMAEGLSINPTPDERDTLLSSVLAETDSVEVSLALVTGYMGAVAEIPVRVSRAAGVAAFEVSVAYPEESLELVEAVAGRATPEFVLAVNAKPPGSVTVSAARAQGLDTYAAQGTTLAVLRFRVANDSEVDAMTLPITLGRVALKGQWGDDFEWYTQVETADGGIMAVPSTWGCFNGSIE